MSFVPDFKPPEHPPRSAGWFLFQDYRLLVKRESEAIHIPKSADVESLGIAPVRSQFLGSLDGLPCYVGEVSGGENLPEPFCLIGLRDLFLRHRQDVVRAAGMANQLAFWNRNHQYCGKCGGPTENKADERARQCPRCGGINYPRLSPAIIVAVVRDSRILLAHSHRFPGSFYSVLAGFVEPGESLEECVRREVFEEVRVRLKNIRYFGSQPWPFPDSLMVAFTAEYAGGEIQVDDTEISDAGWFSADRLPLLPPRISIARQLIDWFVETGAGSTSGRPGDEPL